MNNIYTKLLEVQKEVAPIKKTEDNPFFRSKYVDINGILATLKPLLSKHGLVPTQTILATDGRNFLFTELAEAESGEAVKSSINLPDAMDPQKFGSAVTYYRRYALQSLFALEAEDDDGNIATEQDKRPALGKHAPTSAKPVEKQPSVQPVRKWVPPAQREPKSADQGRESSQLDAPQL
jgi:hypothetical protein